MRHFIDLGTHKFEGLTEFAEKLNLDNNDNVYCYEPNVKIYEFTGKQKNNDKIFYFIVQVTFFIVKT
jgi:uncharacterized protein YpmB